MQSKQFYLKQISFSHIYHLRTKAMSVIKLKNKIVILLQFNIILTTIYILCLTNITYGILRHILSTVFKEVATTNWLINKLQLIFSYINFYVC